MFVEARSFKKVLQSWDIIFIFMTVSGKLKKKNSVVSMEELEDSYITIMSLTITFKHYQHDALSICLLNAFKGMKCLVSVHIFSPSSFPK